MTTFLNHFFKKKSESGSGQEIQPRSVSPMNQHEESPSEAPTLLTKANQALQQGDNVSLKRLVDEASELANAGDKAGIEALEHLMKMGSFEITAAAAKALSKLGDAGAKTLFATINKFDGFEQELVAEALGESKHPDAFNIFLDLLKKPPKNNKRLVAMKGLNALKDDRAIPHLINYLSHGDDDMRNNAAWGLGFYQRADVMHALINALENDRYWQVRSNAASGLENYDDPLIIPPLLKALKDVSETVRSRAAETLSNLFRENKHNLRSSPQVVGPLIEALLDQTLKEDFYNNVRYYSAEALGYLGDKSAEEALRITLHDQHPSLREKAAEALKRLGLAVTPLEIKPDTSLKWVAGKSLFWRCPECNAILQKKSDLNFTGASGSVTCGRCGMSYSYTAVYSGTYDLPEIEGTCPHCGRALRGPAEDLLEKACPACGKIIQSSAVAQKAE